jgi:acetyl-CoA C-acetyltransferase
VARREKISREEQDRYAVKSQAAAVKARDDGFFEREIIPVPLPNGEMFTKDDGPRPGTTMEVLDGAAAVVVMSERRAKELGIKPLARVVSTGMTALEPELMGLGPIEASKQALKRAKMTIDDIDIVEINEAFAAQVIPSARGIGVDPFGDKLNPHGGAIALGHPFGMTGARILCTLLNGLREKDKTYGLETMCVGGGQGMAMIVERLN